MIIVLHGNGVSAISQKISLIKKDFDSMSISTFSGKEVSFDGVIPIISTPQLFSEKRLIILEEFDDKVDLEKLPQDPDLTIILKFNKLIPQTSKLLKTAQSLKIQIITFTEKDEVEIFPLLDAVADRNPKVFLQLDKILDEKGGQYLLTMIIFMLRRFIVSPNKLPGFVVQKLNRQKQFFTKEKVMAIYKDTLETDFKIKNGLLDERLGITLLINKILTI